MTSNEERRRFTRIRFNTAATLVQQDNVLHTHVLDISLNGVLLEPPENFDVRADLPASISIFLSETVEIQMRVQLVHSSNAFLGFHCEGIDVESAGHLRRLIELNMDDEDAPERVLEEMIQPH